MGAIKSRTDSFSADLPDQSLPQVVIMVGSLVSRWSLIFSISIGTGAIFFALSFLIENTYKATTILMPPDHSGGSLSMLAASNVAAIPSSALSAFNIKNPTDLFVGLLSSPSVEDEVIKDLNLQAVYKKKKLSEARQKLEHNVLVSGDSKSGLIFISAIDKDPNRAANVANDYIEGFNKVSAHLAISEAATRRLFFEKQLAETKENLTRSEDGLKQLEQRTGIVQPEGEQRALIGFSEDLRARIAAKNVELESLRTYYSDESVQVQTAQRELAALRSEASNIKDSGNDKLFASKSSLTTSSLEYIRKLRDVRYNETLFELLIRNLEAAKLDEARESGLLQTVSPAPIPDKKDGPHRSVFLLGGLFLGAALTCLWLLIRDRLFTFRRQVLAVTTIK